MLIRAKNDYYGFDLCPGFWDWLETMNASGSVYSVEAVYNELIAGSDDLSQWARDHRQFFLPLTTADIAAVATANRWATNSANYDPAAKAEFARAADAFLIGRALTGGHTVVTHETISDGRRRIKIPNAAGENGVQVVKPFQMLRAMGARFVLQTQTHQLSFSDLSAT